MKRIISIMTALMVTAAMSFAVFGQEVSAAGPASISIDQAIAIALGNAKLTKGKVWYLEADYDGEDQVYELEFTKKKNRAEYDYEIDAFTGKILKKSIDYRYKAKRSGKKIGAKKAQKKVAKYLKMKTSVVRSGTCTYEPRKRGARYEVRFMTNNYNYECDVLARNGQIIEMDCESITR